MGEKVNYPTRLIAGPWPLRPPIGLGPLAGERLGLLPWGLAFLDRAFCGLAFFDFARFGFAAKGLFSCAFAVAGFFRLGFAAMGFSARLAVSTS